MAAENPNFSVRPEQVEGKGKSLTIAFRKCCDHNSISGNDRQEGPLYRAFADFYGYRPNVRPYATSRSSGKAEKKRKEGSNEKEVTVVLKRPATSQGISRI